MFLKIRGKSSRETVAKNNAKSPLKKEGVSKIEAPEEDTAAGGDVLVNKLTSLEELVNKRTKDLEEAKEQLKQLSGAVQDSGEGKAQEGDMNGEVQAENLLTPMYPPRSEVSAQPTPPADKPPSAEKDLATLLKVEEKPAEVGKNDSFANLFSQEEEEDQTLKGLISSLPDVTVEELINEVEEIKALVQARQR